MIEIIIIIINFIAIYIFLMFLTKRNLLPLAPGWDKYNVRLWFFFQIYSVNKTES